MTVAYDFCETALEWLRVNMEISKENYEQMEKDFPAIKEQLKGTELDGIKTPEEIINSFGFQVHYKNEVYILEHFVCVSEIEISNKWNIITKYIDDKCYFEFISEGLDIMMMIFEGDKVGLKTANISYD